MDKFTRFSVVYWGFFLGLFLITVIVFSPSGRRTAGISRNDACKLTLKQLGKALKEYHDVWGSFPPAYQTDEKGIPSLSWRTLILPYLDCGPFYNQYRRDEPWNSSWNRELTWNHSAFHYRCMSSNDDLERGTNYLAVVGPETAWPGTRGARLDEDFPGGPERTILLVEVLHSGTCWFEPRDLKFHEMAFQINLESSFSPSSNHGKFPDKRHINVLFADGHVESLPGTTPPNVLRARLTTADD